MTQRTNRRRLWALALTASLLAAAAAAPAVEAKKKGGGTVDIAQPVNAPIPDRAPGPGVFGQLTSTIEVPNKFKKRKIRDVNVTVQTIGASGASPADNLIAKLTAPNGATTPLFSVLQGVSIGPLTLDDQSPFTLGGLISVDPTRLSAPYAGSAEPGPIGAPLAVMNNGTVKGTWTLRVLDAAVDETSVLSSWRLNVVAGKPFQTK